MREVEIISSMKNPKIKYALSLRQRRDRDTGGVFLIEGYRELYHASGAHIAIDTFFYCRERFLGVNEPSLMAAIQKSGANMISCAPHVFDKVSYRDRPDGLLAIARQMKTTLADLSQMIAAKTTPPLLVLAEAIEKPGNLGTILRSCDAAGADGVIVCDPCTDIYNPNVVRASTGTLFTQPVAQAEGKETLQWLQKNGIKIAAATPHASLPFTEVDLTGPLAIAVGTEQLGLSSSWIEHAEITMRIPMLGNADSLNVAMATTLLLYEALRQRSSL